MLNSEKIYELTCPSCDIVADHKPLIDNPILRKKEERCYRVKENETDFNDFIDIKFYFNFVIVECSGCKQISFLEEQWDSESFTSDEKDKLLTHHILIPSSYKKYERGIIHDAPNNIKYISREIIIAISAELPILSRVGLRILIEYIAREIYPDNKQSLKKKIDKLILDNYLNETEGQMIHKLREIGNRAAHDIISYHAINIAPMAQARLGFRIVKHLINKIYIIPSLNKALKFNDERDL